MCFLFIHCLRRESEMRFVTGHRLMNDEHYLDEKVREISIVDDEGRTVFEVRIEGPNEVGVRGVDTHIVKGKMFSEHLSVCPKCYNSVIVTTLPYGEEL